MTTKAVKVPVDPSNPKTKYRLHVEEGGKTYLFRKTRVGGTLYGLEEAEYLEDQINDKVVFDDQHYINSIEDFSDFISKVNDGSFEKNIVNFNVDIDLKDVEFVPICNRNFKSELTINGNGHTIRNMKVTTPASVQKVPYGGAFIEELGGKCNILDLAFDAAEVYLSDQALDDSKSFSGTGNVVAVVMAYIYADATFKNVSVTNSIVRGYGKVGGIAAMSNPGVSVTFDRCVVSGTTLRGATNVAGLIGNAQRGESKSFDNLKIGNCSVDFNWISDPEAEYVELDTTTTGEDCPTLPLNYPVKGMYVNINNYLYAGKAKFAVNYGVSSHDCSLEGYEVKLANSEICIDAI